MSSVTTCAARREGGIGHGAVAVLRLRHDIAGGGRPDLRRARRRGGGGRGHRGQFLVVDDHRLGAVAGRVHGLADHGDHRLAGEIRLAHRQHRPWRRGERRAVRSLEGQRDAEPAEACGFEVGAGDHRQHAGDGLGLRRVDRDDPRMRMRRAQEDHMRSGRDARGRRRRHPRRAAAARPRSAAPPGRCRNGRSRHPCRLPRSCPRSLARSLCGPGGRAASGGLLPGPSAAMLRPGKEPAHDRHHAAGRRHPDGRPYRAGRASPGSAPPRRRPRPAPSRCRQRC